MPMSKHAQTLLIEGPDARSFAQAQFSSNVNALDVEHWQFSAWLSAQGRVRALFHLVRLAEDKYLLLLRGGDAASVAEELLRFVFRAKLTISALPPNNLATGSALALHAAEYVSDVLSLGCGSHSMQLSASASANGAWPRLQLHMGWPWLPASTLDELLPAALSLQRLAAVVVDKGCYPGQEIVARLHFRGGHKRHLHSGTLSQPLLPGHVLRIAGKEVGLLLDVLSDNARIETQLVLNDDVAARMQQGEKTLFDEMLQVHVSASWPV
jgi:folate-binding protein YgfZ